MEEDLTPSDRELFDPRLAGASDTGGRDAKPAGRQRLMRPGVVIALVVAAALIVFVVQNDSEVPVTWLFIEVNGPLWAVIIVAAAAGAVLTELLGWVVGRRRRRRRRRRS